MFSFIKNIFQCRSVSSKLSLCLKVLYSVFIFVGHWTGYRILGWQFLLLSIFLSPFSLFITLIKCCIQFSPYHWVWFSPLYLSDKERFLDVGLVRKTWCPPWAWVYKGSIFILDYYLRSSVLKTHCFSLWPWRGYYSNFCGVFVLAIIFFISRIFICSFWQLHFVLWSYSYLPDDFSFFHILAF